ncbi:hypothetical protein [Rosistilla oblonga]|uniref:hypothetical protein n=1 Tax=Rosistilla oblonga TaxID=2527990 RepID=UPI003A974A3A
MNGLSKFIGIGLIAYCAYSVAVDKGLIEPQGQKSVAAVEVKGLDEPKGFDRDQCKELIAEASKDRDKAATLARAYADLANVIEALGTDFPSGVVFDQANATLLTTLIKIGDLEGGSNLGELVDAYLAETVTDLQNVEIKSADAAHGFRCLAYAFAIAAGVAK